MEQIAGDLFPEPTLDQLVATGFQRNNITTNEGGVVPEEYEAIYAKDRAETIGGGYLGLTVGCATCHNHKFAPIAQSEFYALTAFFRNTTQYVMDGNVSDPPPILVVPEASDRQRWYDLRAEAAETEAEIAWRAASVDAAFTEWLATDAYRALRSPLDRASEWMRLDLDAADGPVFRMEGGAHPVTFEGGAHVGEGPHGQPALSFGPDAAARLPSLPLDSDTPFSLALWIHQPEAEGNFVVAGQYDPEDGSRGWSMTIGSRQLSFRMTGDEDPEGPGRPSPRIAPSNLKRMPPGEWTHVVITHDGTGERAGLNVFRNGEAVEASGSEFFTKVVGGIRTGRPLLLGRAATPGRGGRDDLEMRHFAGGGIADLRIFNRALTVQEARVVSLWPALESARAKRLDALDDTERKALRLYFLSVEDDAYQRLLARSRAIEREWREMRRRGGVTHVMHERLDTEPEAYVLYRGMYDQPRERVAAGVPAVLPPMAASMPRNRLGLARWLVDDANPLTSRVTVNRFWQQVFGSGLVTTSEDFGAQGDAPTHPELLDWLATEFRGVRLGRQALLPHASHVRHLPAVRRGDPREAGARPREPAALPRPAVPDGRRDGARLRARRQRSVGSHRGWPERPALPAGRRLVDGGDAAEQHAPLPAGRGRQALPAQPLHVLEALRAAAGDGDLQRPDARALHGAAGADEHAAPGARRDERPAVRRGLAPSRAARPARGGRLRCAARLRHHATRRPPVPCRRARRGEADLRAAA